MSLDLDGIRVVDFTLLVPGPYATQLLADLGADVVTVEPPGGDPVRDLAVLADSGRTFAALNHGKRSVELDLKSDAGRAAVAALVADADVVVEGFRPGVAERLEIGYDAVRARNPDVVYCSLTGFGGTGPDRNRPAHDLTIAGLAGLVDLNRRSSEEPPTIPPVGMADMSSGLVAAVSVLGGLLSRELGNGGTYLDVSMFESTLSVAQPLVPLATTDEPPRPGATAFTGAYPWYGVYETADGRYLTLAAMEPAFWEAFCEAVDRPDLVETHDATDPAVREAVREELATLFRSRPREAWLDDLDDETLVAPVETLGSALDADRLRARGIDVDADRPYVPFPALVGADDPRRPDAAARVPAVGEDTAAVLREAGVSDELISRVRGAE